MKPVEIITYMIRKANIKRWRGCEYMIDALEEAKSRIEREPEWTSTKTRLPEEGKIVLVTDGEFVEAKIFSGGGFNDNPTGAIVVCATHWRDIPELPSNN